jgi:hypothetical protein
VEDMVQVGIGGREEVDHKMVPICIVEDWDAMAVGHVGLESHCFPVSVYLEKASCSSLHLVVVG